MATQCMMPREYGAPRMLRHRALFACCLVLSALLLVALIPGRSESQVGMPPDKTTPQEILTRARAFEAENQYDQAIASYRAYLVVRPEDDKVRGSFCRDCPSEDSSPRYLITLDLLTGPSTVIN